LCLRKEAVVARNTVEAARRMVDHLEEEADLEAEANHSDLHLNSLHTVLTHQGLSQPDQLLLRRLIDQIRPVRRTVLTHLARHTGQIHLVVDQETRIVQTCLVVDKETQTVQTLRESRKVPAGETIQDGVVTSQTDLHHVMGQDAKAQVGTTTAVAQIMVDDQTGARTTILGTDQVMMIVDRGEIGPVEGGITTHGNAPRSLEVFPSILNGLARIGTTGNHVLLELFTRPGILTAGVTLRNHG